MSTIRQLAFPEIDSSYVDQFGYIDKDVYSVALACWPQAHRYAMSKTLDEGRVRDLMLITVARVSKVKRESEIDSLQNYLWLVFKRLLLEDVRRNRKFEDSHISFGDFEHSEAESFYRCDIAADTESIIERLNRAILIAELVKRMDSETCAIFEKLILGYTFSDIAKSHSQSASVIRNKFRRKMLRLAQDLKAKAPDGSPVALIEP